MAQHEESAVITADDSRNYAVCAFSRRTTWLLIIGASLLCPAALWLFAEVALHLRPEYRMPDIVLGPGQGTMVVLWLGGIIFLSLLLSFGLIVLHEYCHGLAFRWAGANPRYGAKMLHRIVPIFYATSPGFRMSCRKFRVVLLAPTVVVNLLGMLAMWPPTLLRYLLVFPLGVHLAGCMGDWWMLLVLKQTPADTLIEDTLAGFRYPQGARP